MIVFCNVISVTGDVFVEFPCAADTPTPTKKAIESILGPEADGKRMASQWLYKQYTLRADAMVNDFPRKRPTKKQVIFITFFGNQFIN